MKKHDNLSVAKHVAMFLIFLLALSIFLLFRNYQDNIVYSDKFHEYMGLIVIGLGLMIGLMYLVSNSGPSRSSRSVSRSTSKKKRRK